MLARLESTLVNLSQISPLQPSLIQFGQVTQDKNTRISRLQEGQNNTQEESLFSL